MWLLGWGLDASVTNAEGKLPVDLLPENAKESFRLQSSDGKSSALAFALDSCLAVGVNLALY